MSPRLPVLLVALAALGAVLASPASALEVDSFRAPYGGATSFRAPSKGATLTGGSVAEARWGAPVPRAAEEAELVLSLDGGRTFSVRVSSELPPGATSYRWRVPSVPAAAARLALRVGDGRGRESERIAWISDEFAIAADAPEPGELARGAAESWTEQALSERSARDLLEGSVSTESERLVAAGTETDADGPAPTVCLAPPAGRTVRLASTESPAAAGSRPAASPAFAFLPLRL